MATPYRLRAQRPMSRAAVDGLLGPEVRTYRAAAARHVVWAALPFILLLGYFVWIAQQGLLLHWFNSNFSAMAVAILFVLAIVLIVYTSAVGGGELLRVHANGILDLRSGPRAVRWDEIESLTAVAREGEIDHHLLRLLDGGTVVLGPSIGGVNDLVDEVAARLAERRVADVRARIEDGVVVRFGAVSAGKNGVTVGGRVVDWEKLAVIEAEGDELVLRDGKGERLGAARLEEVPNAFLLAEVMHERRGG